VWISFLIGKRLGIIKEYISNENIKIITTTQLIKEIKIVTSRPKLNKYFPTDNVNELIELLETIADKIEISPKFFISRDPKDNFLLDLIESSKANYLVTGDKDLLILNPFKSAEIITPANFEKVLKTLN
jgi:putative PIN family toxin of toxin-antitoxin system